MLTNVWAPIVAALRYFRIHLRRNNKNFMAHLLKQDVFKAILELALHGGVAALCVMAGFALLNDSPDGRRIATTALVVSFLRVVQSTWWSALPDNTIPGDELLKISIAGGAAAIALIIVQRR